MYVMYLMLLLYSFDVEFMYCYDGDSCSFKLYDVVLKVRLSDIDSIEKGEVGWEESKIYLEKELRKGKVIKLKNVRFGYYGRIVADVVVDGVNVNKKMLRLGIVEKIS